MSQFYLVIDLINDLLAGDPLSQKVADRNVLSNTAAVLKQARAADCTIGYVRVGFTGDFNEAPTHSPLFTGFKGSGLLKLETAGTQVHSDVAPQADDIDIVKHAISPFYKTILDDELTRLGVTEIFISGVSTALAVSSAVREAHDRGLKVYLIEDCCAAPLDEEHVAEMEMLKVLSTVIDHKQAAALLK